MGDVTSVFGRRTRRSRRVRTRPRVGISLTWLVAEKVAPGYCCDWYGGRADSTLGEFGQTVSAREPMAWGLSRTGRVRIRDADGTRAGTGARLADIDLTWSDPVALVPS